MRRKQKPAWLVAAAWTVAYVGVMSILALVATAANGCRLAGGSISVEANVDGDSVAANVAVGEISIDTAIIPADGD